jgi:hypothetical protein
LPGRQRSIPQMARIVGCARSGWSAGREEHQEEEEGGVGEEEPRHKWRSVLQQSASFTPTSPDGDDVTNP